MGAATLAHPSDPMLREQVSAAELGPELEALVELLFTEVEARPGCVGIAAPQLGIDAAVAVVAPPGEEDLVLINPVILDRTGETTEPEGCLSCPGASVTMTRAAEIVVETDALHSPGDRVQITLTGEHARIAQHEIDHLHGRLITMNGNRVQRRQRRREVRRLAAKLFPTPVRHEGRTTVRLQGMFD